MNSKNIVISKEGDTISSIAYHYYGSSRDMVEEILDSNPHLSKQPAQLPAGIQIKMPSITQTHVAIVSGINLWN